MSNDKLIYEFSKNAGLKVVVQLREFRKTRFFDLRIFYLSGDGSWRPTPRGISLRPELIPELKQGIDLAVEQYEKQLSGLEERGRDNGQTHQKDFEAHMNGRGQGPDHDTKAKASREGWDEGSEDE